MYASVREANLLDTTHIAQIHQISFSRQNHSVAWVQATLNAAPRFKAYVIELDHIIGYIFWSQKSGLRTESIIELDQIAIHPDFQRKGLSKILITQSLIQFEKQLVENNQTISKILVSTSINNFALKIYQDVLQSTQIATLNQIYAQPEVILYSDRQNLEFLNKKLL